MIARWRSWVDAWGLHEIPGAVPARPDLGERYPWRTVAAHALDPSHRRAVRVALDRLRETRDREVAGGWRVGLSGGKDSTALAILLDLAGWRPPGISVKDDLDYPGEREYVQRIHDFAGIDTEILTPPVSLQTFLRNERVSLVRDLHGRAADLSRENFYGLLDAHRARTGHHGILLGLRAEESRGRLMNRRSHGWIYERNDGLHVSSPIADWSTIDVHAFLFAHEIPLLPIYLCIDPGQEWDRLRKSWWVSGGYSASIGGHYTWLRRWWPDQWEIAASIDPEIRTLS